MLYEVKFMRFSTCKYYAIFIYAIMVPVESVDISFSTAVFAFYCSTSH